MVIEEAIILLLLWAGGTVLGLIITGLLADRLVIRRIMQNKDIIRIMELIRRGADTLEKLLNEYEKSKNKK
jgi:hypothetical protein